MLIKIIFVFGIIFPVYLQAQTVTWQKWYDYNQMESSGSGAIQTFDGGYLIITNNFGLGAGTLLLKVNYLGNIEWQKPIDTLNFYSVSVSEAADSGFVISGYSGKATLLKTDSKGNIKWIKQYTIPGYDSRFFDHLVVTGDQGIIALGDLWSDKIGFIVKTDPEGVVQWDSAYSLNLIKSTICDSKIDKSFYFTGLNFISKIDSIGRTIWVKNYNNIGEDIIQSDNGSVYIGYGDNNFYLTKLDTSGNLIWQKSYNPQGNFRSFCIDRQENILMTGFDLKQYNIVATKVDRFGSEIFTKEIPSFTGIGVFYAIPYSVEPTNDSGFIFAGSTDYPNFMLRDNAFGLKTDSVCNAPKFVGINESVLMLSKDFALNQNYPNPFNPKTIITYSCPVSGFVTLKVYDILGNEIAELVNEKKSAGSYEAEFDGSRFASGVYIYRLSADGITFTKKMALIK